MCWAAGGTGGSESGREDGLAGMEGGGYPPRLFKAGDRAPANGRITHGSCARGPSSGCHAKTASRVQGRGDAYESHAMDSARTLPPTIDCPMRRKSFWKLTKRAYRAPAWMPMPSSCFFSYSTPPPPFLAPSQPLSPHPYSPPPQPAADGAAPYDHLDSGPLTPPPLLSSHTHSLSLSLSLSTPAPLASTLQSGKLIQFQARALIIAKGSPSASLASHWLLIDRLRQGISGPRRPVFSRPYRNTTFYQYSVPCIGPSHTLRGACLGRCIIAAPSRR
jgi:hypothetical protein